MPKTRTQKEQEFADLKSMVNGKAVVLTEYTGLTVKDMGDLRGKLRESGSSYRVVKTSLLAKALAEKNIEIPAEILTVQLAVASNLDDEVEPNRAVVDFAKTNEAINIKGAVINGEFVDESQVKALASLPGRDELLAKVVVSVSAPLSGMVNVLSGNLRGLVNVLKQYALEKSE